MKRTRQELIRVGLFALVSGGLLLAGLLWIAGSRVLRPRDTYQVLFVESVSGLSAGSQVEYQGVAIGRVRDIRLTQDIPPKVSVTVALEPGTPVRRDTHAVLLGSIVTGIQYIELQGGSEAAGPLPPGGVIPGSVPSLVNFRDRLDRIAELTLRVLTRLDQDVFTQQNAQKISLLIDDLGSVAGRLDRASETLEGEHAGEDLAQMIRRVTRAADAVNRVFSDFYARREGLYGSVATTAADLDEAIGELRALLGAVRTSMGGPEGGAGLVEGLEQATRRLQETLDLIEADPSLLLWGREVPEREFER
jgi:phospholipid/cholesterol/gamma-HCH transport system substrate-binding protein